MQLIDPWKNDHYGRRDEDVGAVNVANLKGEALANALMKATTKAKRRATLSICGLSFLDESEIEAVKGAQRVTVTEDGEIIDAKPASEPDLTKQLAASLDLGKWADDVIADINNAKSKGAVNEIAAQVAEEAKTMTVPVTYRERIKEAALRRKSELS
jgi:hypothetical protein